ncbi:MAG: hypothetical protein Q8O27_01620 [Enterobacteriaceae bacterium]|nr:hypothetical protein [Enterobacteriaceae bacterium]
MIDLMKSLGNKPRKGKIIKCKICGQKFYVKPSHIKIRKTCSSKCYSILQHNRYKLKCKICGKEYERQKSQVKWRGSSCCSKKCANKNISLIQKGIKNKNWGGGVSRSYKLGYHNKRYKIWREKVFKRDNWTCCFCEKRNGNREEIILNAHHIFRFAYFQKFRFKVANGITICIKCHQKTKYYDQKSKLIMIDQQNKN